MNFKDKQKTLFTRQNHLRENETQSELSFKTRLDKLGVKYIFQKGFIAGDYYCIVDFYIPKPYKLVIEIDGGYHNSFDQTKKDFNRTQYLNSRGFNVIRIKNEDVSSYDINFLRPKYSSLFSNDKKKCKK